ncbi:OsmC family protein [Saezia sanguinis]|uniref:OsmC family protein n=1 Tax=Saezia sanguinis TaxID=1965230 RepID=UPI0030391DD4
MSESVIKAHLGQLAYQTTLSSGTHQWVADVPSDLGGGDTGPTPHELLSSSLAACTSITVAMYAKRKNWPLEGIDVTVEVDNEQLAPEPAQLQLNRTIAFTGKLDAEQRQRLLEIADQCPIHKLLTGTISINTTLMVK